MKMKKGVFAAVSAVLSVLCVQADPVWHFGTYEGAANRIWYGDDETVSWVFNSAFAVKNTDKLMLKAVVSGAGALDLTTFNEDTGYVLVAVSESFSGKTGVESVILPESVTSIEQNTFKDCTTLRTIEAPCVVTIAGSAFLGATSLGADGGCVSFPAVRDIAGKCFNNCSGVTQFSFPAVTNVANQAFSGCTALASVELSAELQRVGSSAFSSCSALADITPHRFPALTYLEDLFYDGPGATSPFVLYLDAPELVQVGTRAFKALTIGEFKAPKLQRLGSSAFNKAKFSPGAGDLDLPELTTLDGATFSLSGLTSINAPKLTAIPQQGFTDCSSLTNVVLGPVASIGRSGLVLGPRAQVHFLGDAVPEMVDGSVSRTTGETKNERPVFHVCSSKALPGWQALALPNAATFETFKQKPDCPADAIGLIALSTTPTYAYLVNDAGEAETGYLSVLGFPAEMGEVAPAYGTTTDIPIGDKFPCTAPLTVETDGCRAFLAGYAVSNITATGEVTFRAEGEGNSYAYEQLADSAMLTWVWTNLQYRVTATAQGVGSVDVAEQWVGHGGTATVTATPAAGKMFRYWSGDVPIEAAHCPTLELVVDGVKAVTAVFTDPVDYVWSYDEVAKTIAYGGSDGLDVKWAFGVTEREDGLTVSKYISGEGDLDFSTFAVAGKEIVALNSDVLAGRSVLSGRLNLGTVRNIPSRQLDQCNALKELIAPCVTNIGYQALRGATSLTNIVLSESLVSIDREVFSGCKEVRRVAPERLPALKTLGSLWGGSSPEGLTYSLEAPELETLGNSAFAGLMTIARLEVPKLKQIGKCAFQGVRFAAGAGDLSFPALEVFTDTDAFSGSGITSISAPKLTMITNSTFKSCGSLTNAVFSDCLKRIYDNAFGNSGSTAINIQPLMPANMEYVSPYAFTGSRSDYAQDFANTEFVWDNPLIPEVPPHLVPDAPLAHVVFKSDVTLVQTNAFQSLTSRAVIEFYGPSVPEFVKLPFYYNGEKNDDRVRILVCNKEALAGWRTKVAANDELYRTSFKRQKPDWPGRRTLGILELSGTLLGKNDPVSVSYAWVVDGTPGPGFSVLVR